MNAIACRRANGTLRQETVTSRVCIDKCLSCIRQTKQPTVAKIKHGKGVSIASPPPDSAGCIWDSKSTSFVPTKYTPVAYDSITKQSFNVQLVSGKDPWYLGTLLTKGCNRN